MNTVRAKMKCTLIALAEGQETVTLNPVYSNDPNSENAKWSKWTPGGQLQLTISNPEAMGKFKVGSEYYVDSSEVPAVDPVPAKA